ncbi:MULTISPECIES: hypothetical protein [Mycobacteriaceae]|uniref:Uncharacterized protein n=1 Tax=Mycolicibacterium neoaurum VKM Ac-1815D TaxID=700508 RepID=V5XH82_MYCNE|nr:MULTISPECIES: hypothetical protein [Mycobacteriaceae]AHC27800.1 hypothetical protein D174_02800 [Mycolicibacterium neoaurum VKM Ac-1815D]AMO04273.1 hypothetical protein MyAD_02735 [Mycolicibacterium neoaurum]KJQ48980.1 hypothetical protein TS71_18980 [Mycolicibacterium neoaurum]KUM07542.1 hypothetical protein AVZ31_16400 [Mycolicibacterium neoaurum]
MGLIAELTALAEDGSRPRLGPIIAALGQPVRVRVTGRPGVGCRSVSAVLRDQGLDCVPEGAVADVVALVIAETVKPEDRRAHLGTDRPRLIVLNKADALADPAARAAAITAQTGVRTVPMCALAGGKPTPILDAMAELSAPLRYRRLRTALTRLHALAATDPALAELLAADTTVLTTAAAADEVVRAAGLRPSPMAPLRSAVRWLQYSRGPVSPLHRDCGADLARGQLRLVAGGDTPP